MFSTYIYALAIFLFFGSKTDSTNIQKGIDQLQLAKPNLVFILADQWRAQEMGYAGNSQIKTPNLDKFAQESLIFEHTVATLPVCAPWRASFLTGQYPLSHGIFYNDKPLPNEALTLGEIYKSEGYQTGYIGKWHLNGHQRGEDPFSGRGKPIPVDRRQGFDYWKVREVSHDYNNSFYFDENDQRQVWPGYDVFPQTDSAISFIAKNKEKPFALILSYGPPHDPYFSAPAEFKALYDAKTINLRPNVPIEFQDSARNVLAGYYAHASAIDHAFGKLLQALDDLGLKDNTLLVFTSEHGDMLMSKGVLKKQRPWDESILVPMLMRYPAGLGTQSRVIQNPIGTPDLLPTFLGMSGIKIPDQVEGKDFSQNLIQGKDIENEASLILLPVPFHEWQFSNGGREYRGIRTKRYTYVRDLKGPWLLYDNESDPYQLNNLVDQKEVSDLQKELENLLKAKLKERKDEFMPANYYMTQWNYLYDRSDSIRPQDYLMRNRFP